MNVITKFMHFGRFRLIVRITVARKANKTPIEAKREGESEQKTEEEKNPHSNTNTNGLCWRERFIGKFTKIHTFFTPLQTQDGFYPFDSPFIYIDIDHKCRFLFCYF